MHKKWEAGGYKFAQNVEGLLPKMLKKLWAARKVRRMSYGETNNKHRGG